MHVTSFTENEIDSGENMFACIATLKLIKEKNKNKKRVKMVRWIRRFVLKDNNNWVWKLLSLHFWNSKYSITVNFLLSALQWFGLNWTKEKEIKTATKLSTFYKPHVKKYNWHGIVFAASFYGVAYSIPFIDIT